MSSLNADPLTEGITVVGLVVAKNSAMTLSF
jgi:hypothetical protein